MEAIKGSSWNAFLDLKFQQRGQVCRLVSSAHEGPLYVQKPFYPEGRDLAHVYLLHPPGGLVSGDSLRITIGLDALAKVLVTTPGASRIYRARTDKRLQEQYNVINVADGASMEWLPQETIVYPGACGRLDTQVYLGQGSQFSGWEITCLGLPASGQLFDRGEMQQRLLIMREGRPVLLENLQFSDRTRAIYAAMVGLQSCPVTGIFVAGSFMPGELTDTLVDTLREIVADSLREGIGGISLLNGFIVGRYLGQCSGEARCLFIRLWAALRPALSGRQASLPGIWST